MAPRFVSYEQDTFMVHSHGQQIPHDIMVIPKDTVVIRLETSSSFYYSEIFTHDIWHFSTLPLHKQLQRFEGNVEDLEKLIVEYLVDIDFICKKHKNAMKAYLPGSFIPNMQFQHNDDTFECGVFKLPLRSYVDDIANLQVDSSTFHSTMHDFSHKANTGVKSMIQCKDKTLRDLVSSISNTSESNSIKFVVVLTCANNTSKTSAIAKNYASNLLRCNGMSLSKTDDLVYDMLLAYSKWLNYNIVSPLPPVDEDELVKSFNKVLRCEKRKSSWESNDSPKRRRIAKLSV